MPQHHEPFSYDRHQDAAELLARLIGELEQLGSEIDHSYGRSAAAKARAAIDAIDGVREALDLQLERDFPRDSGQVCSVRLGSVYYPARWAERRVG